MKVMLDTNILISAIFFPSAQTRQFVRQISEDHSIVLCDYVIDELRLVVERKFKSKRVALEQFFLELPFELVHTPKDIEVGDFPSVRDQKDSPILATAILENVDVFVTGDKDFLVLDLKTPQILTMSEFLEQYTDSSNHT